jgi:hypothetical protein
MSINQHDHIPRTNQPGTQSEQVHIRPETEASKTPGFAKRIGSAVMRLFKKGDQQPAGEEQPRTYGEAEHPRVHHMAKQVGGAVLGATLLGAGIFTGVELAGHNAKADSPQEHVATAPANPGNTPPKQPSTTEAAPVAAVTGETVPITISMGGKTTTFKGETDFIDNSNLQVTERAYPEANDAGAGQQLVNDWNTIGHITTLSASDHPSPEEIAWTVEAAEKVVYPIQRDATQPGGFALVTPDADPLDIKDMVTQDLENHTQTTVTANHFSLTFDDVPSEYGTERVAAVVATATVTDNATGYTVGTPTTTNNLIHYAPSEGTYTVTDDIVSAPSN